MHESPVIFVLFILNMETIYCFIIIIFKGMINHIPTVVWMCPILPYINDTRENIEAILQMCIDAQVRGVICFGMGLTLRDGSREYFYRQLDRRFPGLKERYIREYGDRYEVPSPHSDELMRLFHHTCEQNGIIHDNDEIFAYLHRFEEKEPFGQLSLWELQLNE